MPRSKGNLAFAPSLRQRHNFNHTSLSTMWLPEAVPCFVYEVFHQREGNVRYFIFQAS